MEFYTISLQRAYKDKNDTWQHASSLKATDIPKANLVLNKAYEYLCFKDVQQQNSNGIVEEAVL